jgi:hypothetical protein
MNEQITSSPLTARVAGLLERATPDTVCYIRGRNEVADALPRQSPNLAIRSANEAAPPGTSSNARTALARI